MTRRPRFLPVIILGIALLGGCASLPPGSDFPKTESAALAHPEQTQLGQQFDAKAREHDGNSGYRIIAVGADGFLMRMQMINAAQRTLDPFRHPGKGHFAVQRRKNGAADEGRAAQTSQNGAAEPLYGDSAAIDHRGLGAVDG